MNKTGLKLPHQFLHHTCILNAVFLKIAIILYTFSSVFSCQYPYSEPVSENESGLLLPPITQLPQKTIPLDSQYSVRKDSSRYYTFNCISTRFGDINIYDDTQLEKKAGIYTTAPNFQSTPINLAFQFIAPSNDTLAKRPFVLMIHEGAYLFGDLGAEMGKATLMAQKGYAAAAINYRIGFENASETNPCGGTSSALIKALYRSVQDTYAAIAFFVNNSSSFGIDTQNIFLAGSSAGSMTITALNYMDENNFEILYPGITQELGPLKPANLGNFKIKGLLSHLGYAITDLNLINANNLKPTLVFQGANDTILPYTSGPVLNCGNYFTSHGSYPVISRLKQLNAPFEWIVQPNSGHNTTYTNEYITDRYALFIKRLFCNDLRQISIIQQNQIENIKL